MRLPDLEGRPERIPHLERVIFRRLSDAPRVSQLVTGGAVVRAPSPAPSATAVLASAQTPVQEQTPTHTGVLPPSAPNPREHQARPGPCESLSARILLFKMLHLHRSSGRPWLIMYMRRVRFRFMEAGCVLHNERG